ncbi:hypothetical protein LRP88_09325 [Fusarium phalaenopsidis]
MSELESPYWRDIRSLRNELNNVKRLLEDIRAYLPSEPTPQRRSKRSTIRHAMQQDKPPAWAEQIITHISILEDQIGRIQSQTDDIEAHNRRNDTQQPPVHPGDSHDEGSPDQAPANAHGDNSATSTEATGDPSSGGSDKDKDKDTSMRDCEQVPPSPPGGTDAAASAASASRSASRQATANDQGDIPATTPEAETEASVPEDDVVMGDAAQGEGNVGSAAADHRSARFSAPEDDTGGMLVGRGSPSSGDDRTETNQQTQPTAAGAQVGTQSRSNSATPEERAMQLPTTPNSRGSDTTENTSPPTTSDTPLTSPDAPAPDSPSKFTISAADMGEGLVQVLHKYMSDPDFDNKVFVPLSGIDPAEIQKGLDVDYTHCRHTGVQFKAGPKGEGYANVFALEGKCSLDWSKFCSEPVREPTVEEAEEILNRFIDNPPDHSIPYIIGHLKNTPFNEALNPGPAILGNPDLKDLHSEYHHIGLDGSANRFHQEDGTWEDEADGSHHGLCSYNEVYYGYKLWTVVEVHHISKCRDWARAKWNLTKCSEGLSHQCVLIAPATLKRAGIDYKIMVGKPGEAIVTLAGQQHGIVNYGPCVSRSMNFADREGEIQFQKVVYCKEDNMAPVYALHDARCIDPPRKALPSAVLAKKKSTKRRRGSWADAVSEEKKAKTGQANGKETPRVTPESLQELVDKFRAENLLCKVPTLRADQLPTERVLRLACAMSSRLAIQQFHLMVQSWNRKACLREDVPLPGEDPISRIQHRVLLVDKYASMDTLCKYLVRQSQFSLVKEVEADRQGRMRNDSSFIKQVLQRTHWTQKNYEHHCSKGKQWIAICDRNEGILPFLHHYTEPFKISPTQCLNLSEDELSSLASLLDNHVSKALLKAGVAFQQAVEGSRSVRFAWDGHQVNWDSLDENKLMSYLEVVDD